MGQEMPTKLPFLRDPSPRLIHGFLDPLESIFQITSQSVHASQHGSWLRRTGRQTDNTDHATSVARGRIYGMRPDNSEGKDHTVEFFEQNEIIRRAVLLLFGKYNVSQNNTDLAS